MVHDQGVGFSPLGPDMHEYGRGAWEKAIKACKDQLNKEDFQHIHDLQSSDALIENMQQLQHGQSGQDLSYMLRRLSPCLGHFSDFLAVFAVASRGNFLQTALVWGVVNLVITVAATYGSMLSDTLDLLEDMGNDLEVFKMYEWIFTADGDADKRLDALLVDVLVDVIIFWVGTIRFLRRNPVVYLARIAWLKKVQPDFKATSSRIRKKIRQIKERAEAISLREASLQHRRAAEGDANVDEQLPAGDTIFPRSNIPFPRNPHFYGRESEHEKIRSILDNNPERPSYKALTIIGMGGIGKSQLALSYAYERLEKDVPAVFWIDSENAVTLSQSYSEIARLLNLRGNVTNGGYDVNRYLVNQWLQNTSVSWLLVFDNVEDGCQLQDCLPTTARGSILITTRNELVPLDLATRSLKIPVFNPQEGSAMIANILERDSCSSDEREAAEQLTHELDGLALALNIMATHIRLRQLSIREFLGQYQRNVDRSDKSVYGTRSRFYKHSLSTAWKMSFDALDDDSVAVFGVICFIAPDDIPGSLFRPPQDSEQPFIPPFDDVCRLDDAIAKLLSSSLLTKDPVSLKFRVHRLVQKEFRDWLCDDRRLSSFQWASRLLYEAFPKQVNMSSLHPYWSDCELYIQHVMILSNYFTRYSFSRDVRAFLEDFKVLLANATWYLIEISEYDQSDELLKPGFDACHGDESLLYARLCQTAGIVRREQGKTKDAYPWFERTKAVRERLLEPDHQDVANILNNIAGVLLTDYRTDESLAMYQAALDIDLKKPQEEIRYIVYTRYLNVGVCYINKGMYKEAEEALDIATGYVLEEFGEGSHFEAIGQLNRANLFLALGNTSEARKWCVRAHQNFTEEREFHPVTIGARYKLACIDLEEGLVQDAIERLRSALRLCEVCEASKSWQGSTARTLRKLAHALLLVDEDDAEAVLFKQRAEAIRKRMQGDDFCRMPDNDRSYDALIAHYWR